MNQEQLKKAKEKICNILKDVQFEQAEKMLKNIIVEIANDTCQSCWNRKKGSKNPYCDECFNFLIIPKSTNQKTKVEDLKV